MPITYGFLPDHDCNWMALSGVVTREEALAHPDALDLTSPEVGLRWIVFVDPRADLSELTAACMSELHRRMKPIAQALARRGRIETVWVCEARLSATFVSAWRAYLNADPDYPSSPRATRSLSQACDMIALAPGAAEAIRRGLWAQGVGLGVGLDVAPDPGVVLAAG